MSFISTCKSDPQHVENMGLMSKSWCYRNINTHQHNHIYLRSKHENDPADGNYNDPAGYAMHALSQGATHESPPTENAACRTFDNEQIQTLKENPKTKCLVERAFRLVENLHLIIMELNSLFYFFFIFVFQMKIKLLNFFLSQKRRRRKRLAKSMDKLAWSLYVNMNLIAFLSIIHV